MCNKKFKDASHKKRQYCSHSCAIFKKGKLHPYYKNGKHLYDKNRVGDYRQRVKFICCSICGNNKTRLYVHHVDGDRKNGKLNNLKVVCCSCHWVIHNKVLNFKEAYKRLHRDCNGRYIKTELKK